VVLCLSLRHNTLDNKTTEGGAWTITYYPAKAGKSGHPNQTATDSQQVGTYVLNLVFELLLRMCLEYVHSIFLFMDGAFLGARDGGLVFGYTTYYVLLCFLAKWSVFLSLKSLSSFVWRTSELR
jgi:hypothetical protein